MDLQHRKEVIHGFQYVGGLQLRLKHILADHEHVEQVVDEAEELVPRGEINIDELLLFLISVDGFQQLLRGLDDGV